MDLNTKFQGYLYFYLTICRNFLFIMYYGYNAKLDTIQKIEKIIYTQKKIFFFTTENVKLIIY